MGDTHIINTRFAELWIETEAKLFAFLRTIIPDHHQREDISQNVALIAYRKFRTFDAAKASFSTWVCGIAKYEALDSVRRDAKRKVIFNSETLEKISEYYTAKNSHAEEEDLRLKALPECLKKLPEAQRKLLEMRYVQEMTSDDIARATNLTSVNVRVRISRIRTQLKTMILSHLNSIMPKM
jgi:RNA polymerase sigma-70 factor (ECF subfamily)